MAPHRFFSNTILILFLFSCILIGCQNSPTSDKSNVSNKKESNSIYFFYTGQASGELEPCGCSSTKLGGMLLRSGWLDHLKKQTAPLYLIDGGFAPSKWERQDQIKSEVHHRILSKLGYQYQFAGKEEKISPELFSSKSPLLLSRANESKNWYHKISSADAVILVIAVNKDDKPESLKIPEIIRENSADVVFLMTQGVYSDYSSLIPKGGNHWTIIFSVDSQEPFTPLTPSAGTLVISAGNRGRYAGLLTLSFKNGKPDQWKNRIIPLENKFDPNPEVSSLLDQYRQQLKQERLLELQIKRSSEIGFVGSENCIECHQYESNEWKKKTHAHAFDTLVKVKHDYDPECVRCHSVGYEYEEGFRTSEITPYLLHVGCECCHGAGAKHAVNPIPGYGKTDGVKTCLVCHEKDRSPNFDYEKYRELIKHWKE